MHSSGMRTAHLLTVSQHALGREEVDIPACIGQGCVCIPAFTGAGGMSTRGDVYSGWCLPGGVSAQGGRVSTQGVSAQV